MQSINCPTYDFQYHRRKSETLCIKPDADIIIVASNASRIALKNMDFDIDVIFTESSKRSSKNGTLGASKRQVGESLNQAVSIAKEDDIIRIRRYLREKLNIDQKISYKPDIYTGLGIFKGNKWKINPVLYHM